MIGRTRARIPLSSHAGLLAGLVAIAVLAACTAGTARHPAAVAPSALPSPAASSPPASSPPAASPSSSPTGPSRPAGEFTFAFAGDVHFVERTATRLAADPATVFGSAEPVLSDADLTMVNLETAITTGGDRQDKEFTFRAPPSALTALRDGGVDVATMANNHGADYGASGLRDTLAAISSSRFPIVGIGRDAAQAYAPWTTTVNGVKIAVLAASQVQDETLANWTAGPHSAGIASAYSPRFIAAVKAAKAKGYLVIVYLHWGIEYQTCPSGTQESLARRLAAAGATAVIGTHPHVLQGAGWLPDGAFVAYSTGNYLWWRSFGNEQDDNGVLTLRFRHGTVVAESFHPSHLDSRGVPVPATGARKKRIDAEWAQDRQCTDLAAKPPS